LECPVYWREALLVGALVVGPACVEEMCCTTLLEPAQLLYVVDYVILTIKL
jgi:hypothetical protein